MPARRRPPTARCRPRPPSWRSRCRRSSPIASRGSPTPARSRRCATARNSHAWSRRSTPPSANLGRPWRCRRCVRSARSRLRWRARRCRRGRRAPSPAAHALAAATAAGRAGGVRQGARTGAPARRRQREAARRTRLRYRGGADAQPRHPLSAVRARGVDADRARCSSRSRACARRGGARSPPTTSSTASRRRCRGTVSIPNRNYMNLLELPMLFYVVGIVLYVTGGASTSRSRSPGPSSRCASSTA